MPDDSQDVLKRWAVYIDIARNNWDYPLEERNKCIDDLASEVERLREEMVSLQHLAGLGRLRLGQSEDTLKLTDAEVIDLVVHRYHDSGFTSQAQLFNAIDALNHQNGALAAEAAKWKDLAERSTVYSGDLQTEAERLKAENASMKMDTRLGAAVRAMPQNHHLVHDCLDGWFYSRYVSGGTFKQPRRTPDAAMGLCPDHYMPEEIWEPKDE